MNGRLRSASRMLALLICVLTGAHARATARFDHTVWDVLLHRHVVPVRGGHASEVDYAGMRRDRTDLDRYLDRLSALSAEDFEDMTRPAQLAFLINAYNAWTVELILTADPGVASIRDLGSVLRSPWKKAFIPLLGDVRSLDDIEHGMIRAPGRYREPRIHFAVNCASVGCPALREEAYVAERLEQQLEDATRRFLGDATRNRLAPKALEVSSLFRWYRKDFERQWPAGPGLEGFFASYGELLRLSPANRQALVRGDVPIRFLDYDWRLNRVR